MQKCFNRRMQTKSVLWDHVRVTSLFVETVSVVQSGVRSVRGISIGAAVESVMVVAIPWHVLGRSNGQNGQNEKNLKISIVGFHFKVLGDYLQAWTCWLVIFWTKTVLYRDDWFIFIRASTSLRPVPILIKQSIKIRLTFVLFDQEYQASILDH